MELDFEKYCKLIESPDTVLPPLPRSRPKPEKRRSTRRESTRTSNLFTLEEDFAEINFHHFRSISCKNVPSRSSGLDRNEVLRRGSVYQSSNERSSMSKGEDFGSRKKIELSEKDSIFSSFGIIDSLCNSDEDSITSEMKRSSVISKNPELNSEEVLDISSLERAKIEKPQFNREIAISLHKSLSAKLSIPHSPFHTESDSSKSSSPKTRFGTMKKMFDPFTKSKSQRNTLGSSIDSIKKNETFRKSLLSDFSRTPGNPEFSSRMVPKDRDSSVSCSPAHLHGCLKTETKFGVPFFEFSFKSSEEVLVARRWKSENGLNWVYTFHSFPNRRKSNAIQMELKDLKKASTVLGQIQVSCYLHMEMKGEGAFENSIITEFVLYDVNNKPIKQNNSEIAAVVVQLPFEKRESLKLKGGYGSNDHPHPSLLDFCGVKERRKDSVSVNVIVPLGTHGEPNADVDSCGPSSLLERWRSGGGCDCGGWDMGCPITIFGNSDIRSVDDHLVMENQHPFEFFVLGMKEDTPALSITATEEGKYSVDFHAKLSTLQAFSICVAILHCTESSNAVTQEKDKELSKSDSLRVFAEEEFADLIEAVSEDEKRMETKKIAEEIPSFKIKPPFSPMARV